MRRLLSWAVRCIAPDSPAQVRQPKTEQEQSQEQELGPEREQEREQGQDGGEERTSSAPADAYPLDATGWGTCGWPL